MPVIRYLPIKLLGMLYELVICFDENAGCYAPEKLEKQS